MNKVDIVNNEKGTLFILDWEWKNSFFLIASQISSI